MLDIDHGHVTRDAQALRFVLNALATLADDESPDGHRQAHAWLSQAVKCLRPCDGTYRSPSESARMAAADAVLTGFASQVGRHQVPLRHAAHGA